MRNVPGKVAHRCSRTFDTHTERGVDNKQPSQGISFIRPFHTFSSVNLHLLTQVDMHRLNARVVVQGVLSQLTTDCKSEVIRIKFGSGHREKGWYVLPLCLKPPNGTLAFNVLTQLIQTVPALSL